MPPAAPPSDSEDDISLTSTAPSDQLEEYEVETILAQRTIDGIDKYLVKWEGYPDERCTWEPEDSFCDPLTLKEWGEKRAAISRGELPEFDIDALEDRIFAMEQESWKRKGKRRAKRFRLGLLSRVDDDKDEQGDVYEIDSLFDSVDGDERSKQKEPATQRNRFQPTSHPEAPKTGVNTRRADSKNQNKPNLSRNLPKGPRGERTFSAPFRPGPKRQLARRTIPPVVGISATAPNGLFQRTLPRKDHTFDPTDPARVQIFKNLSTKRRHEKASRREQAPDITQLDLRKPGDWLTSRGGTDVPTRGMWNQNHNSGSDSLFVEQDGPMPSIFQQPAYSGASQTSPEKVTGNTPQQKNPERRTSLDFKKRIPGRKFGSGGRYWDVGEVLVTIRFGSEGQVVGNARLCNLDQSTRRQILDTKERTNIDIWFRYECTKEQYALLCETQGNKNIKHSNGWAIGFPDTTTALDGFAKQLRERDQVALWYHPQSMNANVLVAYATGSPSSWGFFDADARFPDNIKLKVVARSPLPPMDSLPPPLPPPLPQLPYQPVILEEQATESTVQPEDTIMVESPMEEDPKLMKIMAEARSGSNNITKVFQEHFEFTYNELVEVNTFNKADRYARAFYLMFPENVQTEYELMVLFLRKNKAIIYSNRTEDDWEKFSGTAQNGTVLFHREFTDYEKMPGLNILLRKQINVFNISLSKPITSTSDRDHIERLFPHGGVILLTEDLIRHDPDTAILITAWFREYILRKHPGSWKLFLRPDIQRWLLKMDEQWDDDRMFAIWLNIRQLIPDYPVGHENFDRSSEEPQSLDGESDAEGYHHPLVSTAYMPGYGYRDENEHKDIPKGLTQEERDTDHLVEYFAGWCWLHAPEFRRYIVLAWLKPQPRWKQWHHINIMRTEDFIKEFKVKDPDDRLMLPRSKSRGPAQDESVPQHTP